MSHPATLQSVHGPSGSSPQLQCVHMHLCYELYGHLGKKRLLMCHIVAVPAAITARPAVFCLQFPGVCEATNEGCVSRTSDRERSAEDTRIDSTWAERATSIKGVFFGRSVGTLARFGADRWMQRQTVIGQFYQLDRLVVEAGLSVCFLLCAHSRQITHVDN